MIRRAVKYKKNILIVEDDRPVGDKLREMLIREGYKAQRISNAVKALHIIDTDDVGLVFLSRDLPDMSGMEVLRQIQHINPSIIVIMMSINGSLQTVVEATQLGAYDWLQKPLEEERVLGTVKSALDRTLSTESKDISLQEMKEKYKFVGSSQAIQRICKVIDRVAILNTTILITGESGTGKEMAAYAIHINSKRESKPFITINCAAVHESLIESELFGHKRGSFTGAYASKKGKIQLADKRTLLLDEIGDLSASAQAKLLRSIETGEVEMLGTEKLERVDVRIITATNKDIRELVSHGVFREDLFHRINVIEIHIPPLRERPEDVLPLADYFLQEFCVQHEKESKRLSTSAEAMLLSHHWPGNVRELRNIIEKMTVLIDASVINSHHLTDYIDLPGSMKDLYKAKTFRQAKRCFEKSYLIHALWDNEWNVSKTAQALKLPRSSLYEKIKEYGIKRDPENQTVRFL